MEKGGAEMVICELSHAISRKGQAVTAVCGASTNKLEGDMLRGIMIKKKIVEKYIEIFGEK